MDWKKVLKKAAMGAVLTGGTAAGITTPGSVDEAIPSGIAAIAGALWEGFRNWFKNRKK